MEGWPRACSKKQVDSKQPEPERSSGFFEDTIELPNTILHVFAIVCSRRQSFEPHDDGSHGLCAIVGFLSWQCGRNRCTHSTLLQTAITSCTDSDSAKSPGKTIRQGLLQGSISSRSARIEERARTY